MKETIMEEAKRAFKPEFLNRLDDVIVFRSLNRESLITILTLETEKVLTRLKNKNIDLILSDKAKDFLVEKVMIRITGHAP
jgi:ATP-dependent Clp protease ATP-binding subunit ClpC